jgi:hypothetical protein
MTPQRRRSLADRLFQKIMRGAVDRENAKGGSFMTVHTRPRRAAEIGTWPEPGIAPARTAVVMQGPIITDHDFTLETLRLYERLMPGAQLILSTWVDTDAALLAPIRDLGVTVVLSEKPAFAGLFNINMQIISAAAGVRRAVADGADWVMKTRPDQRLYAPDVIAYLIALAQAFPVGDTAAQKIPQKHRIIGVGFGSLKFAPYHVTDQTVFGAAEDMLAYWTPPLRDTGPRDGWPTDSLGIFKTVPVGESCRHSAPESYLASQFLVRMGRPLEWTLVDSWAAYRDHFCFADLATTDFYWVKNQVPTQRERVVDYDVVTNRTEIGFRDWLLLHGGQYRPEDARRYEAALLDRYNDPLPVAW